MNAYRDQYAKLFRNGKGVTLLAISTDSVEALASWAHDAGYPFTLLSDSGGVVGRTYAAFNEQYGLDDRSLFVIGPDGKIIHVMQPFREVDPTAYTELDQAIGSASKP